MKKSNFIKNSCYLVLLISIFSCREDEGNSEPISPIFESFSFDLNSSLNEISGLQINESSFYGFNDSGGNTELYKINQSGEIIQTITLENAVNVDWESMAMSNTHVFLADIGNNIGNRIDLGIYYFEKSALSSTASDLSVEVQKLQFSYPEQINFGIQSYNHDFDCEAIFWFNNQLHLLTKEWKSGQTAHYTLALTNEVQEAEFIENYNTNFLVTGADIIPIDEDKSLLGIVGYNQFNKVYLIRTEVDNSTNVLFNNHVEKTLLGFMSEVGQVEGIALKSDKVLYYSAEEKQNLPAHITRLEQTN